MLLLENLEGYGLLITLLLQSVKDAIPFLVFSGVWLCVFCVFYRTLGNTPYVSRVGFYKEDSKFAHLNLGN